MSEKDIRDAVTRVLHRIAPEVDLTSLDPSADLRAQADLDSVDAMNVVVGLHDELGVDVPEADYGELATLDAMVAYLGRRLEAAEA